MIRRLSTLVTLSVAALGCATGSTETRSDPPTPDTFAGAWQSVTPPMEFVRLTITSLSSEQGALGARLTFSGVALEGRGSIDGDSLRIPMYSAGTTQSRGVLVVRVRDAQSIAAQLRNGAAAPLEIAFVREP